MPKKRNIVPEHMFWLTSEDSFAPWLTPCLRPSCSPSLVPLSNPSLYPSPRKLNKKTEQIQETATPRQSSLVISMEARIRTIVSRKKNVSQSLLQSSAQSGRGGTRCSFILSGKTCVLWFKWAPITTGSSITRAVTRHSPFICEHNTVKDIFVCTRHQDAGCYNVDQC